MSAALSFITVLFPGLLPDPDQEPAYVEEFRKNFKHINKEFRVVKAKLNDMQNFLDKKISVAIRSDYIYKIGAVQDIYNEYIEADSKEKKKSMMKTFIQKYEEKGNPADELYQGLTTEAVDLNLIKSAVIYTAGIELFFQFNLVLLFSAKSPK